MLTKLKMTTDQVRLAMAQRTDLYVVAAEAYLRAVNEEADRLAGLLPADESSKVLDIGAGMAGYWIALHHRAAFSGTVDLLDLDREDVAPTYGLKEDALAEAYNSREAVKLFLERNRAGVILGHQFDAAGALDDLPHGAYDLIVSLFSWGYHYPFSVYADWAVKWLKPGGRILLDVRAVQEPQIAADPRFQILDYPLRHSDGARRLLLSVR